MDIVKIVIKGASGYGSVDEAYEDVITITPASIAYEYTPHPNSCLESNVHRKWAYRTNSPLFEHTFKKIAQMTREIFASEEHLMVTDIGPTVVTATFEDKHKQTATFFGPVNTWAEYSEMIRMMIPQTEYIPATLLNEGDYEDGEDETETVVF